jgi:hypothetical protein
MDRYQMNEIRRAQRELERVEKLPLYERQQARNSYHGYIQSQPDRIADEVDHILSGNYGHGFYLMAWRALDESPRMNHPALFGQWVANRCWGCSASFARQAYNKLSKEEQQALNKAIVDVIEQAKEARQDC